MNLLTSSLLILASIFQPAAFAEMDVENEPTLTGVIQSIDYKTVTLRLEDGRTQMKILKKYIPAKELIPQAVVRVKVSAEFAAQYFKEDPSIAKLQENVQKILFLQLLAEGKNKTLKTSRLMDRLDLMWLPTAAAEYSKGLCSPLSSKGGGSLLSDIPSAPPQSEKDCKYNTAVKCSSDSNKTQCQPLLYGEGLCVAKGNGCQEAFDQSCQISSKESNKLSARQNCLIEKKDISSFLAKDGNAEKLKSFYQQTKKLCDESIYKNLLDQDECAAAQVTLETLLNLKKDQPVVKIEKKPDENKPTQEGEPETKKQTKKQTEEEKPVVVKVKETQKSNEISAYASQFGCRLAKDSVYNKDLDDSESLAKFTTVRGGGCGTSVCVREIQCIQSNAEGKEIRVSAFARCSMNQCRSAKNCLADRSVGKGESLKGLGKSSDFKFESKESGVVK